MSCQKSRELLDAYFDGELDVVQSLECENHLQTCSSCRALQQHYQSLQKQELYYEAPESLEGKIRRQLRDASKQKAVPAAPAIQRARWRYSAMAAGIALLVLSSVTFLEIRRTSSATENLTQQAVSSHIRSLMANHLTDVPSSNQHTVKPWFSGKLDFAPPVKDLSAAGFSLVGGRLDYLDDRPVAALVYQRGQHVINLFVWTSPDSDSGPHHLASKGYNVVHGTHSHIAYWAVSDLNAGELAEFARDLAK